MDQPRKTAGPTRGLKSDSRWAVHGLGARNARGVVMLIESTEQFQASAAIAIRRGPNEVAESDFAELPPATRTKLRILQEHGVVRLHVPTDATPRDHADGEHGKIA